MKRLASLTLALCLSLCVLAGCSSSNDQQTQSANQQTTSTQAADRTVTVTDMSGDQVTITGEVKSIINLWPAGTSSFFVMGAGDLVDGLASNNSSTMNGWSKFFYPECSNIANLGGTTPTIEEILALHPDLVIIHPMSASSDFPQQLRDAGIPAINIYFKNYETMVQAYTILGEVLGGEYQTKLDDFCKQIKEKIAHNRDLTKDVADADKPVVYYIAGQSDNLLSTMGADSVIKDWIDSNGGKFASEELNLQGTEVTAEEVFALNPDVIIVGGVFQHQLIEKLKTTDGWKDLDAVKNNRVYGNPFGCFNWDRFGLESYMQIDYALMCIQPDIAAKNGIDEKYMENQVIDFYKWMNGKVLTSEQAQNMLQGKLADGSYEEAVAASGNGGNGGQGGQASK